MFAYDHLAGGTAQSGVLSAVQELQGALRYEERTVDARLVFPIACLNWRKYKSKDRTALNK
ncbi:MAG: hypothetical protein Q9224_003850 [Gallowayella concinna]